MFITKIQLSFGGFEIITNVSAVNVKQRPAVYVKLPENEQVVYPSAFRCLRHVTKACQKLLRDCPN